MSDFQFLQTCFGAANHAQGWEVIFFFVPGFSAWRLLTCEGYQTRALIPFVGRGRFEESFQQTAEASSSSGWYSGEDYVPQLPHRCGNMVGRP